MLDVGDGHQVYWEVSGAPAGKPAVLLHGGPGSGCVPGWRRWFDPERYRLVAFDQRNCGRSTPHASEPDVDLSANTTQHLIGDMELLRDHLGIDRWLVWGGSWGTTLGMAYAEAHPDRVSEMILVSVGTTTRAEVQWVTRAMGRVFPAEWERFVAAVPESERAGDLAAAYSRLLHDPDPDVRERIAREWCAWEDTHVATTPGHTHDERYDDPRFRLCFARLVTHYWSNAAFLDDGALMDGVDRVAGIPAVLIHGRLDISGPPDIPWLLAQRWPAAEFVLVGDAGHGAGHPTTDQAILSAATQFAEGG
jgi:proline iminopeptidase